MWDWEAAWLLCCSTWALLIASLAFLLCLLLSSGRGFMHIPCSMFRVTYRSGGSKSSVFGSSLCFPFDKNIPGNGPMWMWVFLKPTNPSEKKKDFSLNCLWNILARCLWIFNSNSEQRHSIMKYSQICVVWITASRIQVYIRGDGKHF